MDDANPDHPAARLEQTLLQARALIESTVSMHRQRSVAAPTDIAVLAEALDRIIGRARYSVGVALTGSREFADSVLALLAAVPTSVAVRVLCSAEAADASLARLSQIPESRIEVRVLEGELREIVVVDGAAALVRGVDRGDGPQVTAVNDAAAVRALDLLFAGAWSRGRKLAEHLALSPRLRSELTRKILEQLRGGHTDDAAARDLKVSLRTYRRHVAEIMRELDAHSRFQAGARAVELGLLSE
ncbi:DNA-binding response regulator [Streptomyces sp. NBC_00237]|uniref:helix-turn-helix transcriptional regulator n=1 Tax=Streptomyces sp. NBC_00237 TaxID=2975687 RepID=UPI00225B9043|nr:DNA-binding response regulator [Streptomyces sp. NBC_00237]MCX5203719.1 DNA-binding response regulator [Streptomyces sp. NBC_00237]